MPFPRRGLYAVTDTHNTAGNTLVAAVEQAILGGAVVVQYRDKSGDDVLRREQAVALLGLCRRHHICFLVNDDVELAHAIGADGVHVGSDDPDLESARERLGPEAIVGVSCYNRPELAREAVQHGADYVAFGSFFASDTKPGAVRATIELLETARAELDVPLVAIGGITPDNGGGLLHAGADLLAVIRGVFGAPDVCAAASRYTRLFDNTNDQDQ